MPNIAPEKRPGLKKLSGYKGPKRGPFVQAPNTKTTKPMRKAKNRLAARMKEYVGVYGTKTNQTEKTVTILTGSGGKLTFHKPGSNK